MGPRAARSGEGTPRKGDGDTQRRRAGCLPRSTRSRQGKTTTQGRWPAHLNEAPVHTLALSMPCHLWQGLFYQHFIFSAGRTIAYRRARRCLSERSLRLPSRQRRLYLRGADTTDGRVQSNYLSTRKRSWWRTPSRRSGGRIG